MSEVAQLPQHVLDNRFLQPLVERLLQPEYVPPEDEEAATTERVGFDLEDAVAHRRCDCDPDKRGAEGFDEDTNQEDGWFCSFRNIEDDYQLYVVLDRARSAIDSNRGDFPESIYKEICERYNVEQAKLLEPQEQKQDKVLVEILLFAQAANPHAHITLSHVNAYLLTFVNSTPLLWAHVDFLYPLHLVHLYFKRSADVPLRVVMLPPLQNASPFLNDVTWNENKRVMQFMRTLYPHRHRVLSLRLRCRDFRFEVSAEEQIPASEFLWDGSMVKLELFELELDNSVWRGQTVPSSSSIRDLRLHGRWTTFFTPLLSSRLTSLTLTDDDTSFAEVISALQAAPCLVSLTLRNMSLVGAREGGGSLLTFNQLESLSLIRVFPTVMQALFSCITAPNLVSIALQSTNAPVLLNNYNRLPLLPTPRRSVRRLDLTNCEGGPSTFASFFRNFPCITHLRIASSNIFEQHLFPLVVRLSLLGKPDITGTACPNLKHLTIDNEFNSITGVIRLIAVSRHSAGIPLESVTLRGIPMDVAAYDDISLGEIIPKLDIGGFDQELDVYGDTDACSASETSSEGDWASGDEEIVIAYRKYGQLFTFESFVDNTFDGDWETEE